MRDRKGKIYVAGRRVIDRKSPPKYHDDHRLTASAAMTSFGNPPLLGKQRYLAEPPRDRPPIDQRYQQYPNEIMYRFEKYVRRDEHVARYARQYLAAACCVIRQKRFVSSGRSGLRRKAQP